MKQKFAISVADIAMNIISEGTREELDAIVAKVDGDIRNLCSKSNNISKAEAAILCAMDYYSSGKDAIVVSSDADGKISEIRAELEKANAANAKLEEKLNSQKDKYESAAASQKEKYEASLNTQKEKYEGRIENMKEKYEARIAQLKAKLEEIKGAVDVNLQQMSLDIETKETKAEEAVETKADLKEVKTSPKAKTRDDMIEQVIAVTSAPAQPSKPEDKPAEATTEVKAEEPAEKANKNDSPFKKKNTKVASMFEMLTFGDV